MTQEMLSDPRVREALGYTLACWLLLMCRVVAGPGEMNAAFGWMQAMLVARVAWHWWRTVIVGDRA